MFGKQWNFVSSQSILKGIFFVITMHCNEEIVHMEKSLNFFIVRHPLDRVQLSQYWTFGCSCSWKKLCKVKTFQLIAKLKLLYLIGSKVNMVLCWYWKKKCTTISWFCWKLNFEEKWTDFILIAISIFCFKMCFHRIGNLTY